VAAEELVLMGGHCSPGSAWGGPTTVWRHFPPSPIRVVGIALGVGHCPTW